MTMNEFPLAAYFGELQAAGYDERWKKMAPISEILHFLMRTILSSLPDHSRVLCVGAGTGAELIALARHFPTWTFVAVEPSLPMLEVCRRKMREAGLESRCKFHGGFLDSLPATEPFDAATSILVSQFLTIEEDRRKFFQQIGSRLKSGGILITADLANGLSEEKYEALLYTWLTAQSDTKPSEPVRVTCAAWGSTVAVSKPAEIESLIESAGFSSVILFYQALFIHAWYARTL